MASSAGNQSPKGGHSNGKVDKNGDNDHDMVMVNMADVPKAENIAEAEVNEDFAGAGESPVRGDISGDVSEKTESSAADGSGDRTTREEGEDEWEDVLGNSLLRKKVNKPGDGRGTRPEMGSVVTIKTKTVLLDEKEVDVHDNFKFVLGDGDVIQALDLCVALMELHEESVIATGYKYAWGELGRKPDIPPKADLMIFVELLQVDPPPDYITMDVTERLKEGNAKRERGNFLYRRSEYSLALNSYTKGLKIIDPDSGYSENPEVLQEVLELRVKLFCNTAACQNKLSAHDAAVRSCEQALKLQPTNTKALYRCGKAYEGKGERATAIKYLKLSLKYDETNSKDVDFDAQMVHAELAKLTKELKRESEKEKQIYQKMFGGPPVKKKQESLSSPKSEHIQCSPKSEHIQSSPKSEPIKKISKVEPVKSPATRRTKDDLDTATEASLRTVTAKDVKAGEVASGSGAQNAISRDPEKDIKNTLIHFLRNFGIVIGENDPYANLHIQTAVAELADVLETVNKPEARSFVNTPKPRNIWVENRFNEPTTCLFNVRPRRDRNITKTRFSNTASRLRYEMKNGNGNAKLSFTGDSLHDGGEGADSDGGSSVDSEELNLKSKQKRRSNWLWAAAGGAVAAAAVSFGVYRYMNH